MKNSGTDKAKRIAAEAAVRIARHYFGLEIHGEPNKKRKLLGTKSCKFFGMANELNALNPLERHAYRYLLRDASIGASKRTPNGVPWNTGSTPPPIPDEL